MGLKPEKNSFSGFSFTAAWALCVAATINHKFIVIKELESIGKTWGEAEKIVITEQSAVEGYGGALCLRGCKDGLSQSVS